jgi:hypothetical protein
VHQSNLNNVKHINGFVFSHHTQCFFCGKILQIGGSFQKIKKRKSVISKDFSPFFKINIFNLMSLYKPIERTLKCFNPKLLLINDFFLSK